MASHAETKIDCSKVYVKQSSFSNEQTGMFDGAFAAVDIKEGDLVEKGLMRRLPEGFDGNTCPYIFTWSTERPNKVREYMFSCVGDIISDAGMGMQSLGLGEKGSGKMQKHWSSHTPLSIA